MQEKVKEIAGKIFEEREIYISGVAISGSQSSRLSSGDEWCCLQYLRVDASLTSWHVMSRW